MNVIPSKVPEVSTPSDSDRERRGPVRSTTAHARAPASWLTRELSTVQALWRRDMTLLLRQRSRWMGIVLQPLLFWLMIGSGMSSVFAFEGRSGGYGTFFFPGILAMVVLFTAVFATMSVIEDRQRGFLQQVLVAPGSRAAMVSGKLLGVATMAVLQASICLLAAPLAGISLLGIHWPLLFAALLLGSISLAAINFALAWVIDSTQGYHAIIGVVMLPLWVLSGAMFPVSEGWVGYAMLLDPISYLVDGIRHALAGGHATGTTSSPAVALAVLAAISVAGIALAVRTVNARMEGGRA